MDEKQQLQDFLTDQKQIQNQNQQQQEQQQQQQKQNKDGDQNKDNKQNQEEEDNFSDVSNAGSEDMNEMIKNLEEDLLAQSQIVLIEQNNFGMQESQQDQQRREKVNQYFQLEHNLQKQHLEKIEDNEEQENKSENNSDLSISRIYNRKKSQTIDRKPQDDQYDEYVVQKGDSIFGLALNLNTSELDIYPGQKIKLPKQKNANIQEEQKFKSFDDQQLEKFQENRNKKNKKKGLQSFLGVNYFELVEQNKRKNKYYKHIPAFYCTKEQGNIAGILRVTDDMIMFDPDLSRLVKKDQYYYKYQVTVEMRDVHNCELVNPNQLQSQGQDDFAKKIIGNQSILQLSLYTTGNSDIEQKYANRLKTMRKQGKPIIVIFFMSSEGFDKNQKNNNQEQKKQEEKSKNKNNSNNNKHEQEKNLDHTNKKLNEIKEHINQSAKQFQVDFDEDQEFIENIQLDYDDDSDKNDNDKKMNETVNFKSKMQNDQNQKQNDEQEHQGQSMTRVPLYDIISKNFYGNKQRINNLWQNLIFLPRMVGPYQSQIMNQKQFLQILIKFPNQFRCNNWQMVYGNKSHGFSFTSFINNVRDIYPVFIVAQEVDGGGLFGAYISCPLNKCDKMQGDADTFVFTTNGPHNKNKIVKPYYWSGKNSNFFHIYSELIIGAGKDSALFIDRNLKNGHSFACDTFDSPQLSHKQNFQVKFLEVWGLAY
ncbi:hypothetical protein PPERSA_06257 [Pseudocohnilembus persalinus]|uniref:Oxidation resistance protein 1 n=1 Tax=Pseudocohnilembus persalinus TaxID=266149 RepID=A0A0V0QVP2_PSEPJ|nr:hypothetical protein PPERSA_06257 [Pseudocohnilembus persalinus]|eukprot:KRX06286.1 hypothetical protein PPERSA_06257 [Pseudocohnilembus persalinus]